MAPQVSIPEAIDLFRYSNTALGGNGQVGTWPGKIIAKLRELNASGEVGFAVARKRSNRGSWQEGRAGFDLRVNTTYIESLPKEQQLPALSLVLVHEATHASLDFTRLYDEMAARRVPIYYYRELIGPGVFNETADIPGKGPGKRVTLPKGGFRDYGEQSEALKKEQLVDFVLSRESYADDIDAQWVIDNIANWGGLKNRWPETKANFIDKLAVNRFDTFYTARILDVMESVDRQADWDTMLDWVESMKPIREALQSLSSNRGHADRIQALNRKWKIDLTAEPARRR